MASNSSARDGFHPRPSLLGEIPASLSSILGYAHMSLNAAVGLGAAVGRRGEQFGRTAAIGLGAVATGAGLGHVVVATVLVGALRISGVLRPFEAAPALARSRWRRCTGERGRNR